MKDIKLSSCSFPNAKLRMIGGPRPYLGVELEPEGQKPSRWYYFEDKDLGRLEKAVIKCREARKLLGAK